MIRDFFDKNYLYAVVGATTDRAKYGYIVLKDLAEAGFKVVGVNPKYKEIDNILCYPSVELISPKPDVVIFVVPPRVGLEILTRVKDLGITKVWFQPGAESDEIRKKIKEFGLQGMADGSCIMVARKTLSL